MKSIAILGGGTAGWMMASALAKHLPQLKVTLIESQQLGRIGVGEGSTPLLKNFMHNLGIDETQWMARCDASFKAGIHFDNWNGDGSRYFHPFYSEMDINTAEVFFVNANARRRGFKQAALPNDYFLSGHLAKLQFSPKTINALPREQPYGYHFDANKLADVLKEFSINRGIEHVVGEFQSAQLDGTGNIKSLTLSESRSIDADFFIDASGFNALLIEKTLKVPFKSFSHQLLNDSAVTIATAHDNNQIASATTSRALNAGWMWQIPLTSRIGNGYVYASDYLSQVDAEQELAKILNLDAAQNDFKHLKMKVGTMQKALHKNVLAIGLAQSFIEPIEATSLMVTQYCIERFIELVKGGQLNSESGIKNYNDNLNTLISGIKDYVVGHYVTSKRCDTAYWQYAASMDRATSFIKELLAQWKSGDDIDAFLSRQHHMLAYYRPSWYCLLGGMDVLGDTHESHVIPASEDIMLGAKNYLAQLVRAHFIDHGAHLRRIEKYQN